MYTKVVVTATHIMRDNTNLYACACIPQSLMPTQHLDPVKAIACRWQWNTLQRQTVHESSWRTMTVQAAPSSLGHGRGRWPDLLDSWEDKPLADLVKLNHHWLTSQISLYTIQNEVNNIILIIVGRKWYGIVTCKRAFLMPSVSLWKTFHLPTHQCTAQIWKKRCWLS